MATEVIPPNYVITAEDKRGLLVVTVAVVFSFVWVCFLIRLWLRLQMREWKPDDWVLAVATVRQVGLRAAACPVADEAL